MSEHNRPDFAKPFLQARWVGVLPRSAACPELPRRVLLHAGPPFRAAPPAPVINAGIQAILFDGLASNAAAARDLIVRGEIEWRPAQDYRIATPLAQVVSASMQLIAVEQHDSVCYAPLCEGPAPALRFGSAAPECLDRMRDVSAWVEACVAPRVRAAPIAMETLIRQAVAAGDECHARTAIANAALAARVRGLDADGTRRLMEMPGFVLPVLMAAACAAMLSHRGGIAAVGGNGVEFGVRRRGEQSWRRLPAEAPRGPRFANAETAAALAAIGDSAVIDFCGLGGQALSSAPTLLEEWGAFLPVEALMRPQLLIDPGTGIVDDARIERSGLSPLINLAILDRSGGGLIGRGIYSPPAELFSARPRPIQGE